MALQFYTGEGTTESFEDPSVIVYHVIEPVTDFENDPVEN